MGDDFNILTKRLLKSRQLLSRNASQTPGNDDVLSKNAAEYKEDIRNITPNLPTSTPTYSENKRITPSLSISELSSVPTIEYPILDLSNIRQSLDSQVIKFKNKNFPQDSSPIKLDPIYSVGTVQRIYRNKTLEQENKAKKRHHVFVQRVAKINQGKESEKSSMKINTDTGIEGMKKEEKGLELPEHTVIFDNLSFSKYCTDISYKQDLTNNIKRSLNEGSATLLCSPYQNTNNNINTTTTTPTGTYTPSPPFLFPASTSNINDNSSTYTLRELDPRREAKQLLKTIFCSVMTSSGHDLIPPVIEKSVACEMLIQPRHNRSGS